MEHIDMLKIDAECGYRGCLQKQRKVYKNNFYYAKCGRIDTLSSVLTYSHNYQIAFHVNICNFYMFPCLKYLLYLAQFSTHTTRIIADTN